MTVIYVDADGCPVRGETQEVAARHGLMTYLVSDGGIRPYLSPLLELVIVPQAPDAADDWIAAHIGAADVCVTNDIPLAARCLELGAFAIRPDGRRFTSDSVGMALAQRRLMQGLREIGEVTGGPVPFRKSDRSAFRDALETTIQSALRGGQ